jgi:phenylacetate-CoA ligase
MTEIGPWGFECEEVPGGMHIMENEFIAEVIDPGGTAAVSEEVAGELVLTNLGRWGSPLIRYRTGDVVRMHRGQCRCGRWFSRVEGGILGRADDMVIIRGNNVYPSAIEGVIREFSEVAEFQVEVTDRGSLKELLLRVEPTAGADSALPERIGKELHNRFHFSPRVEMVPPGSLPRFEMKASRWKRNTTDG